MESDFLARARARKSRAHKYFQTYIPRYADALNAQRGEHFLETQGSFEAYRRGLLAAGVFAEHNWKKNRILGDHHLSDLFTKISNFLSCG